MKNNPILCVVCFFEEYMVDNLIKEEVSRAYVYAVTAQAGFQYEPLTKDRNSVDCKIIATPKYKSAELNIQMKATQNWEIKGQDISFPLPIKNYDELRKDCSVPRILVVLLLPKDGIGLIEHLDGGDIEKKHVRLKHVLLYISLKGYTNSPNSTTITIKLPLQNIFNMENLYVLFDKIAKDKPL